MLNCENCRALERATRHTPAFPLVFSTAADVSRSRDSVFGRMEAQRAVAREFAAVE
jgi:hypothetical protein